jgi:hypothetical protein
MESSDCSIAAYRIAIDRYDPKSSTCIVNGKLGTFTLRDRSARIATTVSLRSGEVEHCSISGAPQRSRLRYNQSEKRRKVMNINHGRRKVGRCDSHTFDYFQHQT